LAVSPTSTPDRVRVVTMVTPVANAPRALRNWRTRVSGASITGLLV
jgi:hypothetical protein